MSTWKVSKLIESSGKIRNKLNVMKSLKSNYKDKLKTC